MAQAQSEQGQDLIFWTLGPSNRFRVCMVRRRVASEKRRMALESSCGGPSYL